MPFAKAAIPIQGIVRSAVKIRTVELKDILPEYLRNKFFLIEVRRLSNSKTALNIYIMRRFFYTILRINILNLSVFLAFGVFR